MDVGAGEGGVPWRPGAGTARLGPSGDRCSVLVGGYLLWEVLGSPVPDRVDGSLVLGVLGFPRFCWPGSGGGPAGTRSR